MPSINTYTLVLLTWSLTLSLLASTIAAIPTISVKGAKFFANGQQFFIKGVAYQGTPSDPLTDVAQCNADATLMATLGTNSIRVYHVSPYADHSGCMSVFAALGIYVWLDLDTFNTTIAQDAPAWTPTQFYAFTQVLDAFVSYSNLAGVWIGNEIINTAAGSPAAPFIKAAVADIKAYIALKKYRPIPIGYSAADIAELRPALQNYLACSPSSSPYNIDFFGLNSYEWCGSATTYDSSGYAALQNMSATYSLPIFFSETGCNVVRPRVFADQAAIFGPAMRDTWSGSIVYEWVQEANGYGLVSYPANGVTGQPQPIQPDFANLASQWATLSPSGVVEASYTSSFSPPPCPSASGGWLVNGEVPVPTLGAAVVSEVAASIKPSVVASTWTSFPTLTLTGTETAFGVSTATVLTGPGGGTAQTTGANPSSGAGSRAFGRSGGDERAKGVVEVLVVGWVVAALL